MQATQFHAACCSLYNRTCFAYRVAMAPVTILRLATADPSPLRGDGPMFTAAERGPRRQGHARPGQVGGDPRGASVTGRGAGATTRCLPAVRTGEPSWTATNPRRPTVLTPAFAAAICAAVKTRMRFGCFLAIGIAIPHNLVRISVECGGTHARNPFVGTCPTYGGCFCAPTTVTRGLQCPDRRCTTGLPHLLAQLTLSPLAVARRWVKRVAGARVDPVMTHR